MSAPTPSVAPTSSRGQWLPALVLMTSSVFWGLTWLPLKYFGEHTWSSAHVTAVAHGTICTLAVPYLLRTRALWWSRRGSMALIALAGGLANIAFSSAVQYGNVLRVMALFYLLPVWGVLGGRWLLREHIDLQRWASLGLALVGAWLVLGAVSVFHLDLSWIDALAVLSGMALALNNILFRKLEHVPVPSKVCFTFVGTCCWALLCLASPFAPPGPDTSLTLVIYVMLFGVAYLLPASLATLWGVSKLEAGRSSVLIIVELLAAVTSSSLWTRQVPSLSELLGGACIVLAAVLEGRRVDPA